MASKSLTFDIYGRDKSATKTIRKVGREAETLGDSFKRMGKVAAVGLAVAAGAAIKFGADSVKAYAEAEESQKKLEFAYEKFPKLADENIESLRALNTELMKKTRFDDDAIAVGQAQLAQFELTGKQIKEMTPLLLDYAAKTGKDLPTAAKDLGKALLGQGRSLKDVGIDFQDTGTLAGNFDQIMSGLRGQVGGFAEQDAQSAAGKLEILQNRFGEVQEKVGEALMPALEDLMGFIEDDGMPVIEDLASFLSTDLVPALKETSKFFGELEENTGWLQGLGNMFASAGDALNDMSWLWDDKTLNDKTNKAVDRGGWFGDIIKWGEDFDRWWVEDLWGGKSENPRLMMEETRRGMGGGFAAIGTDVGVFRQAFGSEWGGTWSSATRTTQSNLSGILATTGNNLGQMLSRTLGFGGRFGSTWNSTWSGADSATRTGWGRIKGSTATGMKQVGTQIGGMPAIVRAPFNNAGSWLMSAGKNIIRGLVSGIGSMIGDAAAAAARVANQVADAARKALGIKSPSRVFRDIGIDVGRGYQWGLESSITPVAASVEAMVAAPTAAVSPTPAVPSFSLAGARFVLEVGGREFDAYVREEAGAVTSGYDKSAVRSQVRGFRR